MVRAKNEKLLSADIDSRLVEKFLTQASKSGFTKKRALAAAIKHWLQLPLEVQAQLLNDDSIRKSFDELVRQIADEQIKKALKKKP